MPANMHGKGKGLTKTKKARKVTHGSVVSAVAKTKAGGKAVSAVARKKR
jgi:hypothetical protein